ncbi:hypothetical protein N3K66_000072 [Trichothecium roseum]|uniref:Uncharacterized protein n=1 Tax=Trichothecium roseum TaxID=47278 RepID=A0ACC0VCP7_9HYPO|nr:hypothetical protein N3K66_000072 [Trichothecium roseum]
MSAQYQQVNDLADQRKYLPRQQRRRIQHYTNKAGTSFNRSEHTPIVWQEDEDALTQPGVGFVGGPDGQPPSQHGKYDRQGYRERMVEEIGQAAYYGDGPEEACYPETQTHGVAASVGQSDGYSCRPNSEASYAGYQQQYDSQSSQGQQDNGSHARKVYATHQSPDGRTYYYIDGLWWYYHDGQSYGYNGDPRCRD